MRESPSSMGMSGGLSRPSRQYLGFTGAVHTSVMLFQAYYILYLESCGLSFTEIGVVFSMSAVATAVFDFPTGNVADRYGRRRSFVIGAALLGIGALVYALTSSFEAFIVAEVVMGLSMALISGAPTAWLVDELRSIDKGPEMERTLPIGSMLSNMLGVVAGIVASVLVTVSLSLPFLVAGLLSILIVPFSIALMRENHGDVEETCVGTMRKSWEVFRSSRPLQLMTLGFGLAEFTIYIYLFTYQPYMVSIGLPETWLGGYFSMLMLATAIGGALALRLIPRRGRAGTLLVSDGGLVVAMVVLALTGDLAIVAAMMLLCALMNGTGLPALEVWRNEHVPSNVRASVLSLMSTIINVVAAVSMVAVGWLLDVAPVYVTFSLGAVCAAASAVVYVIARGHEGTVINV